MAAMTDYLENKLRDHVLRNVAYTSPTTVYLALFSTSTTEAGGGTEAAGGSYARQAVTFGAPATGHGESTGVVTFTNMPAGTWTHGAIMDASSAGNMLLHGALTNSITTNAGDDITFAAGDIDSFWA